ncbi:glycoside hydrolase family 20 protein [Phanerochaete carnosa HHB-10118-sp]|uniref:Beta-hexosaminidase n=1 Tax=Phanerochaete carnosa (strain HHB-10118-sp) TaxID=650164 RepID=K5WX86_PHACS|nr:glycoside hydrolase family 20 protein [Phanerochaete carnosa HHB-10118-sp]EKM55102.1 glycoside hydrolase family 20 protein [Phanerochaete carnosa HHB-10118-sp]
MRLPIGLLVALQPLFFRNVLAIWPAPRNISSGEQTLLLSPEFSIVSDLPSTPQDLEDAVARTQARLFADGLGRLVVGRGANDSVAFSSAESLCTLRLALTSSSAAKSIADEAVVPFEVRNESYALMVPANGSEATLTAPTTLGLLRGLTTFEQLWYTYSEQVYAVNMPLVVHDSPAYPHRGFGLDSARNFFPVPDIKRTLDAMSWVKLNALYWHVVDSQSFPLEVSAFPELSQQGAYSAMQVYSEADVQDIISYAAARGIDVVLELDTPGHETAIGLSHPEHVACYLSTPWADFASEPPAGQLRLATPATVNFTVALVASVSAKFRSALFSTGGDEVNANCYTQDTQTQADLAQSGLSFDEALNEFLLATHAVIRAQGKTPIVKEDMILNHNTTLPNTTIAVVWISSQDAKNVTERGYRVIHQPSDYFYLDCGGGGWVGDDILGNSWCDPFKTWQRIYSFDPLANLTAEEASLVIGGQIPIWSEQSGPENLDPIVWPRAASAAEVFWSGGYSNGAALNVTDALPRLHDMRFRMVQRGIKAIPLQPEWCALRPNACDLNS